MATNLIIQRLTDIQADFNVERIEKRDEPRKILMCSPEYFDIIDVKNPYMESQEGMVNKIIANQQWNQLKGIYEDWKTKGFLDEILVIPGAEGREDMVFCANQSFPFINSRGEKAVIISKMRHPSRQLEVPFFEQFYLDLEYQSIHLNKAEMFEGMGDTIPHPGRKLYYGGYGHRSNADAYDEIQQASNSDFILLELITENFYHLDTCFVPLSEDAVMLCKDAFTDEGFEIIKKCFKRIYEIPAEEALSTFCLNTHVLTESKVAVLQSGSIKAKQALEAESYQIYETETGEFMKSGGSVFCMKMMVY
jgi:N-dimethylarginine dimethylaminohydrolase